MKKMKNYAVIAAITIAFLSASTLDAQEWTKEQKEVWTEVENMWKNWQANDIDAAFANVDEGYLGWNNELPVPTSKAKWMASMKNYSDKVSRKEYNIEPVRIVVKGDAAVVHFYFSYSYLYTEDDEKHKISYKGKWSDFFIKDGGNWMLLGDFTYSKPSK